VGGRAARQDIGVDRPLVVRASVSLIALPAQSDTKDILARRVNRDEDFVLASPWRRSRWRAALAFALPLAVYLAGMRYVGSGDTEPAELLPISVLTEGNLDFNEFFPGEKDLPYAFRRIGPHVVSNYPVLPGLVNVPAYAAAKALGVNLMARRELLSLLTAAVVAALSSLFLYLCLTRICGSEGEALLFSLVYSFGTCVWSVASHGMWQHGPSLLFLTAALWLLQRDTVAGAAWSGVFLSLAVLNRPTNALLALPLALFVFLRNRRAFWAFAAAALAAAIPHVLYTRSYWGSAFSLGTANVTPGVSSFRGNPLVGLTGLLVSPSRGLLVFSPFFVFSAAGAVVTIRRRRQDPGPFCLLVGALSLLLLYSKWTIWWGGHTFGYRLLIEIIPALMILLAIGWRERVSSSGLLRAAFFASAIWAVGVQALGAFGNWTPFNERMDENPSVVWSVRESQIPLTLREAIARLGW
jgi:hypothetical protein